MEMRIIARRPQIPLPAALDHQRLVAAAEQMRAKLVPMVKPIGVRAQKPPHPSHQVARRRLDDQMKVVLHQTIGMDREARLPARLGQGLDEIVAISLVQEDRLAPVAPAHDVINRSCIFHAHLARHDRILPSPLPSRKPN
jgi:hypothetical protein